MMMFTILREGKRTRLFLELGAYQSSLQEDWFKLIPAQKKLTTKEPVQFMCDWISKINHQSKQEKSQWMKEMKRMPNADKMLIGMWMHSEHKSCVRFLVAPPCLKQLAVTHSLLHDGIYITMYTWFISKNPGKSKKELKAMLGKVSNVPSFLLQYSTATLEFLSFAVEKFIVSHRCVAKECGKFSLVKCPRCRHAHYCNTACQARDYSTHNCEDHAAARDTDWNGLAVKGRKIQAFLQERRMFTGKPLSFEEFTSIVEEKIFEASFNSLDHGMFLPKFNQQIPNIWTHRLPNPFKTHLGRDLGENPVRKEELKTLLDFKLKGKPTPRKVFLKQTEALSKYVQVGNPKLQFQ